MLDWKILDIVFTSVLSILKDIALIFCIKCFSDVVLVMAIVLLKR